MNSRQMQPMGDRILVERDKHVRKVGLIELVGGRNVDMCVSKVLARGPDVKTRPWELAVGDYVMHVRVAGVKYDNVLGRVDGAGDWVILKESEVLAVVAPDAVVTGEANDTAEGRCEVAAL